MSTVKEALIKKVRNDYIAKPDFKPELMEKLSVPAGAMCSWVCALSNYQKVYKNIVPKQQRLAEVSKAAEEAKAILDEKLAGVRAA